MTLDPRPYAELCRRAYGQVNIEVGEARALTGFTADGLVAAFQGTHDALQALDDLDVRPRFMPGIGYVHHGFADLADAAYPQVCKWAGTFDEPLILTGHSLGAAIAILIGARMVAEGRTLAAIIGFGAPRVSVGPAVARVFRRAEFPVLLYRNGADAVPELPPIFSHPAALLSVGTPSEGPLAGERDHAIDSYIAALDAAGGSL